MDQLSFWGLSGSCLSSLLTILAKPEEDEMVCNHCEMILTLQVSKQLVYRLIFNGDHCAASLTDQMVMPLSSNRLEHHCPIAHIGN